MIAEQETLSPREIYPKSHRVWIEEQQGVYSKLEVAYSAWISSLAVAEDLFKKNVYENQDFTDSDARQHRHCLCNLMATGEKLAFDFLAHGEKDGRDVQNYVGLIDGKVDAMRRTLHLWHGQVDDQNDIPDSFKKGMQDIEKGKVVDMERALTDAP
jgi:hypothetical protein